MDVCPSVCLSVCLSLSLSLSRLVSMSVTRAGGAQTVERIEVPYMRQSAGTVGDPRNIVFHGVAIPHGDGERVRCGLRQITFTTGHTF